MFLVLNKIDVLKDKAALLPLIERTAQLTSSPNTSRSRRKTGDGLDELRDAILDATARRARRTFRADHITDQPERFLAAELIREKILARNALRRCRIRSP